MPNRRLSRIIAAAPPRARPAADTRTSAMLDHIRPAVVITALFTALVGLAYPLAMTGVAAVVAPSAATGSLETRAGAVVGSRLIGQPFVTDRYFHGRPSAAGAGYDAAASSGSNFGPTSAKLIDRVRADATALKAEAGTAALPADAVTASGSGLDPHVSPGFAQLQTARVARARGLAEDKVRALVEAATEGRVLGLFGEPRVNVLRLNLALDASS